MMNRKNLEGSTYGLIKILCQHLPGGIEENHKEYSSG
jgi:hypothetical protein